MGPEALARSQRLFREWQLTPEQTLEDWVYLLMVRPDEAQKHLTEAGEKAVPALVAALRAADTRLFIWQICDVLIRIGSAGRAATPVLEGLLASRPSSDHLWIALAMAQVDPAQGKPAVPALERCLRDLPRDAPVHDICAGALAAVRSSRK
jgi:predicted Zn-dependent protease